MSAARITINTTQFGSVHGLEVMLRIRLGDEPPPESFYRAHRGPLRRYDRRRPRSGAPLARAVADLRDSIVAGTVIRDSPPPDLPLTGEMNGLRTRSRPRREDSRS